MDRPASRAFVVVGLLLVVLIGYLIISGWAGRAEVSPIPPAAQVRHVG